VISAAASILFVVGCGDDDDASTPSADSGVVTTLDATTIAGAVETTGAAPAPTDPAPTTAATGQPTTTTAATATTAAATTTAATTAPPAPVVFTPPEGGYTVTFPGQPTALNQQAGLPDGTTLPYVIYSYKTTVDGDARELGSSMVPYPPGTAINLSSVITGAVAAFPGAHLISAEAMELQGRPGAQFSIDLTRGGAPQYYMSRVFTDGTNLYQVYYLGGTVGPTDPDVLAFFDSLELPEGG